MLAGILCKLTSNTKLITTKNPTLQKLKQGKYVYVFQPKADRQRSKTLFTEFRWISACIIEKVLSKNNCPVRKIGTNKMQRLHRMRMRQFTTRQPTPDIRITPKIWKPDPEVGLNHDDLYARAWECEDVQPIFDAEKENATPPSSPKIAVPSDLSTHETRNTP